MSAALQWDRDGRDWPHRAASCFVEAAGVRWHVQRMVGPREDAPVLLLLHGTAASTHSWAGMMPLLAQQATVVAMDLPGHAFSTPLQGRPMSLGNVADAVSGLVTSMACVPSAVVGHSAGAAIAIRMALDGAFGAEVPLVALNGALLPFDGFPGRLFSPLAKMLAGNQVVANFFSWRAASRSTVERILTGTGSTIGRQSLDIYTRLFQSPEHVAAALGMMAHWDLETLVGEMARLTNRLTLVACGNDLAVPAETAFRIQDQRPAVAVEFIRGLGHLAHEERPEQMADMVLRLAGVAVPSTSKEHAKAS